MFNYLNNLSIFKKKSLNDIIEYEKRGNLLKKELKTLDLTFLGISAIIGAGIFSTIGTAAYYGGPGVSVLFVFTALACCLSALCYAQFASIAPISGSAYTYSYIAMGEIFAWIIGWDLILEYAIGNIAVAISWSDYFSAFLKSIGISLPTYLTTDFFSAKNAYYYIVKNNIQDLPPNIFNGYLAYLNAPSFLGQKIILNLPAFLIVFVITVLVYTGIKSAKKTNNFLVLIKIFILLLIIIVGSFYVKKENLTPFFPNGISGVLKGTAGVFFAYIGFDAISTTAEECKNPKKQLPIAIILSLIITTILYFSVSIILTGMVSYKELLIGDPLAYIFEKYGLTHLSLFVSFSALISMTGVLLVFQLGQPRIWMVMSRDGLLPSFFSKIHSKFKTPYISTIITGLIVGVPALFTNLQEMTDLTSIGTLFAFTIICASTIAIENKKEFNFKFKVPYINSRFILPLLWFLFFVIVFLSNKELNIHKINIKYIILALILLIISIFGFIKKWSSIPVLGLMFNIFLLSEISYVGWIRFIIWLVLGLFIYFLYAKKLILKIYMKKLT